MTLIRVVPVGILLLFAPNINLSQFPKIQAGCLYGYTSSGAQQICLAEPLYMTNMGSAFGNAKINIREHNGIGMNQPGRQVFDTFYTKNDDALYILSKRPIEGTVIDAIVDSRGVDTRDLQYSDGMKTVKVLIDTDFKRLSIIYWTYE